MPVSIVCVFNDEQVRRHCLDRSIEDGRALAPQTEYIPMDNTAGAYATAGAALNAGAAVARHDVVAFALSHDDLNPIREEDPVLVCTLFENLMKLIATRLGHLSKELVR